MADDRAQTIFEAAFAIARESGPAGLTKPAIAERAECAPSLINHYFGAISTFWDAIVIEAINREDLSIIARAMAEGHPAALAAPNDLKGRAALSLIGL